MLSDQNAFQSFVHIHLDHLWAIVLNSVMHEYFIFVLVSSSACIYMRATVEIRAMLNDMPV